MSVACFIVPHMGVVAACRRRPDLAASPLALVDEKGRVVTVSPEADRAGVHLGQAETAARSLCRDLVVVPYDREGADEAAREMWDILAVETSYVEPSSPEVCYAEIAGLQVLERSEVAAAAIRRQLGGPVHVGLGRTLFVARMAARQARDGVVAVPSGMEAAFLAPIPLAGVEELEGKLKDALARLGVKTLGDVAALDRQDLNRRFKANGEKLRALASGGPRTPVRPVWPPRFVERRAHFDDREVEDLLLIEEAMRRCAASVSETLLAGHEFCRTLTLSVRFADNTWQALPERLALPLNRPEPLYRAALRLYKRMEPGRPITEVRLRAADLGPAGGIQLALLDDNQSQRGLPHERKRRLHKALETIGKRFGAACVRHAGGFDTGGRTDLWTYPLGHRMNVPVDVVTNDAGEPVRYRLRECSWDVTSIQNRWCEAEWDWERMRERTIYRVETWPAGLCELSKQDGSWRIAAIAD